MGNSSQTALACVARTAIGRPTPWRPATAALLGRGSTNLVGSHHLQRGMGVVYGNHIYFTFFFWRINNKKTCKIGEEKQDNQRNELNMILIFFGRSDRFCFCFCCCCCCCWEFFLVETHSSGFQWCASQKWCPKVLAISHWLFRVCFAAKKTSGIFWDFFFEVPQPEKYWKNLFQEPCQ